MTEDVEPAIDEPATDDDRHRRLLSLAERERFERVLRMLPRALQECSPQHIGEVLVEGACQLANARVGWVVLTDTPGQAVAGGPDAGRVDAGIQPRTWAIVPEALAARSVRVVDDLSSGDSALRALGAAGSSPAKDALCTIDGRPLRSLSALPIEGGGDAIGVLLLAHHRANALSRRRLSLVASLADHLGRAMDLCTAMAEQARVATALQETLLPPVLPDVPGAELAARYRPSGSGNLVGGDFYDVFSDGRGGWYVLLGDASGIGPEAAGLAGVARYTARALAETASGPTEILTHINAAVLRAAPADRFCTAVLAKLVADADGMLSVTLSSGGHPPPYVQRSSGSVEIATAATGLMLGILPDAALGEARLVLGPGDAIAFYTDGVTEAHGEGGEQFGEDRLAAVLTAARGRSAAGTARRIERAVMDFRSPEDRDDLAIVVVRCRPLPAGEAETADAPSLASAI